MKSLKLFTVLSSVVAIGGTSAFAILTTSCGGDKVKDFGTWNMNGQTPTTWPDNIADAVNGYEIVTVIVYLSTDYDFWVIVDYMTSIIENTNYNMPYMFTNPSLTGFNFYGGQPGTYDLKVLVNHFPNYNNKFTYLGKLQAIITSVE